MIYYNSTFMPYHMYGFGSIFMILFWFGLAYLIITLIRGGMVNKDNSLNIIKDRYAKGELTKEQFEQMKKDLQ